MGAGHSHRADRSATDAAVKVRGVPRQLLLGSLVLAAAATVVGLFALWPQSDRVDDLRTGFTFAGEGTTFPRAVVDGIEPACPPGDDGGAGQPGQPGQPGQDGGCGRMRVTVLEGQSEGTTAQVPVPPHVADSGLQEGDTVRLMRVPDGNLSYFGTERPRPLWVLTVLFVLVVGLVARFRGIMALVGLGFAGWIIATFLLPGLLTGESALLLGLVACSAIMFVVIYTTHGFSVRTSVALAGTLLGIGITALVGAVSIAATRLTGIGDEGASVLVTFAPDLDFQGLLTCAVMIAGLGVLNDVTITQASAIWELRAASGTMTRSRLLTSGMRIGRDHIASTIYTIAFAYTGTALTTLLVLSLYDLPLLQVLSTEEIAQEVVRTLVTSIGLVLAVPLTTVLGVVLVPGATSGPADEPDREAVGDLV
ncbi:YibE/F family protein [Nocardioides sp. GCM10027113]|uniref:YibE/F family protein n=1 Tax=unclassified Nocardioides TaxID=2615069 RepID=UPI003615CA4C